MSDSMRHTQKGAVVPLEEQVTSLYRVSGRKSSAGAQGQATLRFVTESGDPSTLHEEPKGAYEAKPVVTLREVVLKNPPPWRAPAQDAASAPLRLEPTVATKPFYVPDLPAPRIVQLPQPAVEPGLVVTQELSVSEIRAQAEAIACLGRAALGQCADGSAVPVAPGRVDTAEAGAPSAVPRSAGEAEKDDERSRPKVELALRAVESARDLGELEGAPEGSRRKPWTLIGGAAVALGFMVLSFWAPEVSGGPSGAASLSSASSLLVARAGGQAASAAQESPALQREADLEASRAGAASALGTAESSNTGEAAPAPTDPSEGAAQGQAPEPPADGAQEAEAALAVPAPVVGEEKDSSRDAQLFARADVAADLYIKGRFKEALNEYRVLAKLHPKTPAYAQFARILRRRLIETCRLTKPERAAECEQL